MQIRLITLTCITLLTAFQLQAQNPIPRLFLDAPHLYLTLPNVNKTESFDRAGAGVAVAMNVATYHATARVGGSFAASGQPKADDFGNSVLMQYGGFLEGGLGLYRTNGNRCAKHKHGAYTAMAVGGVRYDGFSTPLVSAGELAYTGLDYTLGAELGYFYIRDIIKNSEVVLRSNYHIKKEVISVELGFKIFWNLKGER